MRPQWLHPRWHRRVPPYLRRGRPGTGCPHRVVGGRWAVVICFYAVDVSFVAGTLACIVGLFVSLMVGNLAVALFSLGAGLAFAGLTILMFFVCIGITKAVIKLTGWMLLRIKISFVGRED